MSNLENEIEQVVRNDAMARCRELSSLFGAQDRPRMTFDQQAEAIEHLLERCVMSDDKIADLVVTRLDHAQLADLAGTALRLRKMAPFEDGIKSLVTGR